MKKVVNAFYKNPYLGNCEDTTFTVLLHQTFVQNLTLFNRISKIEYYHGLLQYPSWKRTSDIFAHLKPIYLKRLRSGKAFFVFDSSTEGFSPIYDFPFFEILYHNCEKYNVNPRRIIFVSSNLRDEHTMKRFAEERNLKPMHVFSFPSFEQVLTIDDGRGLGAIEEEYNLAVNNCKTHHSNKFFSSLSRVNRKHRNLASFLLWSSDIRDRALISQDKIPVGAANGFCEDYKLTKENCPKEKLQNWLNALPLTVDRHDFNTNWAISTPYRHIHDQTIFQIVNETLADPQYNTSLFYSEKTFRPIAYFQPFVIYGQPGCNRYLQNIGYKTYEDWFDLSFDDEEDFVKRYKKLLESVTDVTKKLESMSKDQRIEWRFKNKELLIHNFTVMTKSQFSKDKLLKFLQGIENEVSKKKSK